MQEQTRSSFSGSDDGSDGYFEAVDPYTAALQVNTTDQASAVSNPVSENSISTTKPNRETAINKACRLACNCPRQLLGCASGIAWKFFFTNDSIKITDGPLYERLWNIFFMSGTVNMMYAQALLSVAMGDVWLKNPLSGPYIPFRVVLDAIEGVCALLCKAFLVHKFCKENYDSFCAAPLNFFVDDLLKAISNLKAQRTDFGDSLIRLLFLEFISSLLNIETYNKVISFFLTLNITVVFCLLQVFSTNGAEKLLFGRQLESQHWFRLLSYYIWARGSGPCFVGNLLAFYSMHVMAQKKLLIELWTIVKGLISTLCILLISTLCGLCICTPFSSMQREHFSLFLTKLLSLIDFAVPLLMCYLAVCLGFSNFAKIYFEITKNFVDYNIIKPGVADAWNTFITNYYLGPAAYYSMSVMSYCSTVEIFKRVYNYLLAAIFCLVAAIVLVPAYGLKYSLEALCCNQSYALLGCTLFTKTNSCIQSSQNFIANIKSVVNTSLTSSKKLVLYIIAAVCTIIGAMPNIAQQLAVIEKLNNNYNHGMFTFENKYELFMAGISVMFMETAVTMLNLRLLFSGVKCCSSASADASNLLKPHRDDESRDEASFYEESHSVDYDATGDEDTNNLESNYAQMETELDITNITLAGLWSNLSIWTEGGVIADQSQLRGVLYDSS